MCNWAYGIGLLLQKAVVIFDPRVIEEFSSSKKSSDSSTCIVPSQETESSDGSSLSDDNIGWRHVGMFVVICGILVIIALTKGHPPPEILPP